MKNKINIKFGKKTLPFHFGLSFLGEFLEGQAISLEEIDEKLQTNPFKFLPRLMHESYKHALLREDKEGTALTYWRFVDVLDENGGIGTKQVQEFIQAFTESLTKGVPVEEDNGDAKKK